MAHEILSVKCTSWIKNWNRPTVGFSWRRVWIRKDFTNRSRIFDRNVRKAVSLWKTDFAIPRQTGNEAGRRLRPGGQQLEESAGGRKHKFEK